MSHLRVRLISALVSAFFLAFVVAPATPAGALTWNCRVVIAESVSFFAASSGSATTYPHTLYTGQFFKSHGVVGTRYSSERRISGVSYWGYVTTNASWVQQTANGNCNW